MTGGGGQTEPQPLLDLPRLAMAVRRRRRIWVTLGLLGFLAGAAFPIVVPAEPTAVASILVQRGEEEQDSSAINTDVALLHTTRIADAALKSLHSPLSPRQFLDEYEAAPVTDDVLRLTVHARTDRAAVARASSLARAFVTDHAQRMKAEAKARSEALLAQRKRVRDELDRVNDTIAQDSVPGSGTGSDQSLYSRRADLLSQISDLGKQANEAKVGKPEAVAGTQVVDRPRALPRSLPRAAATDAAVGLVLGLLLGLVFAAVAGVSRQRPVLRAEIAEHLGGSVIAESRAVRRRWPAGVRLPRRRDADLGRIAATLARAVRGGTSPVSLLELGCPDTCAALAWQLASRCAETAEVVLVDGLPARRIREVAAGDTGGVVVRDARDLAELERNRRHGLVLGAGTVGPGTSWTDLGSLGQETVLLVRAGYAEVTWLHTVARQLADLGIDVLGIVLVNPDRRDRSDGTLWDGLHAALRGRAALPARTRERDDPYRTQEMPPATGRKGECAVSRAPTTTRMARG